MKNIAKERIIFDNYGYDFEDWKESFIKDCEEDYSENTLWEIFFEEKEMDWDDMKYEINKIDNAYKYIIFESVGRWNGVYSGAKIFDDIMECINFAIEDCDCIKVYDTNGMLNIVCTHHDGSCNFSIKALTPKGVEYYERWYYGDDNRTERQVHEQIIKRYSHNINYANKVFGCPKREYEKLTKERLYTELRNKAKSFYY